MEGNSITQRDSYIALGLSILCIAGSILLKLSLIYGFLGGIIATLALLLKGGFKAKVLTKIITDGLWECRLLFVLILLIGATVSVWIASGVVPVMIYYGLTYMNGINFLFAAFIITSIMAIFMGTAIGTISTIGIALLGVGKGFGVPTHMLLGAIISGAFIADKLSPISGLLNLTLTTTGQKYREVLSSMMKTFLPIYIITLGAYYFIGRGYNTGGNLEILEYQAAIIKSFNISIWLLLLPIGIIVLSILGIKTIKTIALGLIAGASASTILQKQPIISVLKWIIWGYRGATPSDKLNSILISGGVAAMLEVVLIVAGAVVLSSLLERSQLLKPILSKAIDNIETEGELILKTGLISSILTIVTCDQTVGIILPGRVFQAKYKELKVEGTVLTRTISDTGTIIAPLFPWNVNALIVGMISGISALNYWPYAVLCYISPIITLIIASLEKNTAKKTIRKELNV